MSKEVLPNGNLCLIIKGDVTGAYVNALKKRNSMNVQTVRRSDSISTRTDGPNTLTLQSAGTNDTPREPVSWPHYMVY